ncbi:MAG: tight junction protein ZO-3 [Bifidobacterium breve]
MKRGSWSVESTIGLVFTIALAVIVAMVLAVIGLTAYAVANPTLEQTIIQKVETTGDVRRLCIEAKTGERIDAMSCDLIDPHTGGVAK